MPDENDGAVLFKRLSAIDKEFETEITKVMDSIEGPYVFNDLTTIGRKC